MVDRITRRARGFEPFRRVLMCGMVVAATAALAPATAPWERRVGRAYENRGIARVEKLGNRWVLNVMCDGTHATYLAEDGRIDPARYAGRYLTVRYHYAERLNTNVKCLRPPCDPVRERVILLERVKTLPVTPDEADARARNCHPAGAGKRNR